jgi:hypothetical protein
MVYQQMVNVDAFGFTDTKRSQFRGDEDGTSGQLGRAGNGMDGRGNRAGKSKCLLDSLSKYNSCFANPMWPAIHMVPNPGSISFPVELMAMS